MKRLFAGHMDASRPMLHEYHKRSFMIPDIIHSQKGARYEECLLWAISFSGLHCDISGLLLRSFCDSGLIVLALSVAGALLAPLLKHRIA